MSKLVLIVFILVLTGCSAVRLEERTLAYKSTGNSLNIEELARSNLTNSNFNISKATIEIINKEEKQKFIASLKYRSPGTYLFSLRNRAGIEGARIFLSNDTILINDRLNKKIYYGSPEFLQNKYGISTMAFPVITGDYINENGVIERELKCNKNQSEIEASIQKKIINYKVNCDEGKITETEVKNETGNFILSFRQFKKEGDRSFPQSIKIVDNNKEYLIEIFIEKIEFENLGEIKFIPGKDYKKVKLK